MLLIILIENPKVNNNIHLRAWGYAMAYPLFSYAMNKLILFYTSSAASTVCFNNIEIVTGPTPPGTGVMALAFS
jgi:hypothetical protein